MEPRVDNSVLGTRSNQNLSCNWTGTADFGRLVPFHWEELIKGDKVVRCRPKIELQMLPLASPTFGKMDLYVHYFFVPTRLIWKDAYDFFSGTGPMKNAIPPFLTMQQLRTIYNSDLEIARPLFKHWTSLGLPPFFATSSDTLISNKAISLLPFRAYRQIWWDFYRDPELIRDESKSMYLDDTSGHKSDVDYVDFLTPNIRSITNSWVADLFADAGTISPNDIVTSDEHAPWPFGNSSYKFPYVQSGNADESVFTNDTFYVLDGQNTSADSSRMLRLCETLTRLSERLSLSGKRQIEAFMARYGAKPNWLKMNMCQYLGGAKSTVLVSDITASADTANIIAQDGYRGTPLGAKAGVGYSRFEDLNIEFEADEPGYLMGIFSVMPHVHFVQGIDKRWNRNQLTDFYQKSLEHVGNVAVSKQEIACTYKGSPFSTLVDYGNQEDSNIFAFRDPYYEYKVGRDILAGDFMYYHNDYSDGDVQGVVDSNLQYMHSMEMYVDYPHDRNFSAENLLVDGQQFNKLFYYLGGSLWQDVDDHLQLDIDKDVLINRPMDGFAIPTLETTEDPHNGKASLPTDSVL